MLSIAAMAGRTHAQVGPDRLVNAAKEARNWLIYSGGYFSQRHSGLTQITPANAKNLELKWMYQAAVAGRLADDTVGRRRRHVPDAAAERRRGARRQDRPRLLDLPPHAGSDAGRLLRREQPRPRDSRRHALHGHARRPSRRHRREDRPPVVEHESGREQGGLLGHPRSAGREGQGHRRRRRRRVRHPRVRCCLRRAERQGSVALLHDSGAE